jgi:hypothetical protein
MLIRHAAVLLTRVTMLVLRVALLVEGGRASFLASIVTNW